MNDTALDAAQQVKAAIYATALQGRTAPPLDTVIAVLHLVANNAPPMCEIGGVVYPTCAGIELAYRDDEHLTTALAEAYWAALAVISVLLGVTADTDCECDDPDSQEWAQGIADAMDQPDQ